MKTRILFVWLLFATITTIHAQNAKLEVQGNGNELVRIHSTLQNTGSAGIEFLLGNAPGIYSGDWRIINDKGTMRYMSTNDNFNTDGNERLTIQRLGDVGIGVSNPQTSLHIGTGAEASPTDDGYLLIGDKEGFNLVFDQNEINSRNNGNTSSFYLQRHGGNLYTGSGGGNTYLSHGGGNLYSGWSGGHTYLSHGGGNSYTGVNGGHTFLSHGGGSVSIGNSPLTCKLNVVDDGYQMQIRNTQDGVNDWFIGASSAAWAAGDNQLLFSPSNSSSASIFRLKDVADNNGTDAPVVIADGSQRLLFDGNEIDATSPLFINHNTDQNTYINPTGGKAAVGSTNPWGRFHVEMENNTGECLSLKSPFISWSITPSTVNSNTNLFFRPSSEPFAIAGISSVNGAWLAFSDRRFKENINTLPSLLDKVNRLGLYSYNIIGDESKTPNIGVVAQELMNHFPELVSELEDRMAVNYGQLSVVALKAIQELSKENDALKAELTNQKDAIKTMQIQIASLLEKTNKSN